MINALGDITKNCSPDLFRSFSSHLLTGGAIRSSKEFIFLDIYFDILVVHKRPKLLSETIRQVKEAKD